MTLEMWQIYMPRWVIKHGLDFGDIVGVLYTRFDSSSPTKKPFCCLLYKQQPSFWRLLYGKMASDIWLLVLSWQNICHLYRTNKPEILFSQKSNSQLISNPCCTFRHLPLSKGRLFNEQKRSMAKTKNYCSWQLKPGFWNSTIVVSCPQFGGRDMVNLVNHGKQTRMTTRWCFFPGHCFLPSEFQEECQSFSSKVWCECGNVALQLPAWFTSYGESRLSQWFLTSFHLDATL